MVLPATKISVQSNSAETVFLTICRTTPPLPLPLVRERTNPSWILSKIFRCTCYLAMIQTLPKALRTQALTALTSIFGLVGLLQYAW